MRHRPLCPAFLVLIFLISVFQFFKIPFPGSLSLSKTEKETIEYRSMEPADSPRWRPTAERTVTVCGTVSERWKSGDGYTYILKDTSLSGAQNEVDLHKVRISSTQEKIKTGTRIKAKGKLAFFKHASNPGGFDSWFYYAGDDIYSTLRLRSYEVLNEEKGFYLPESAAVLREKIAKRFTDAMGERCAGILSAMLLGDRSALEEDTRINYTVSGLGHLLAISGLHVGIIGAAILSLLKRAGLPNLLSYGISVGVLWAYCLFTGSRDSTSRAFLMFTVMVAAKLLLRSYDMLSALSLAGILLLVPHPARLFRAGFMLSFGAVAGLGTVYPVLKERFKPPGPVNGIRMKTITFFREGFFVWLSVTAVTLPIVLWHYNEMPLYAAAANVLFVPMTEGILLLGILGGFCSLILPFLGKGVLILPKLLITLQDHAGSILRQLPNACIITGQPTALKIVLYYTGLVILMLLIRQTKEEREETEDLKKRKLGPASLVLASVMISLLFIRPFRNFSITALDVGQGDSLVVTTASHAVLIDGGSSSSMQCGKYVILPYLKNQGISALDAALVTHSDSDHMNGILEILELSADKRTAVRIKRLLMPKWMETDEIGERLCAAAEKAQCEVVYLSKGDQIRMDDVKIRILAPCSDDEYTGNEGSLVAGLDYEDFNALFTGDLEGKAEEELAKELSHYDYLKAAHHGSSGSTSEAFLAAVAPDLTVFSAPVFSQYNHPGADTIERVENAGSAWLQTGTYGAVRVRYRNGKMLVD